MVRVRKERRTEFGRETAREGEERKGTFPRAPLFSPSRQLVMYVKLRQPWTSSCSLLFPSRARNPFPSPSSLLLNACHVGYFLHLTTCSADSKSQRAQRGCFYWPFRSSRETWWRFHPQNNHMVPFETTTTKTNSYKLKTDSKCWILWPSWLVIATDHRHISRANV